MGLIKDLKRFWLIYLLAAVVFCLVATGTDRAITTLAENQPLLRQHQIIIDAGHGGIDGGATSCTGVLESHLNLTIALRLEDLSHLLGYDTVMIRTTDESIYTEGSTIAAKKASDLKNRAKIVNETENGFLISIHQNIFSDSRYHGAQVFFAPTAGSEAYAALLQTLLMDTINPGSNRQIKPADKIYLMQHIQKPGILIECGFLSNPEEEGKLRTDAYQKKLCCVILAAWNQYLRS